MTHEYPEWSALPAHDDQLALALGFDTPEMISASKNNLARLHALYQQAMRTGIVSAPYSVPAACQEPPQTDDYEQRRAQVAKRRNPQPQLLGWFWINESSVADHQVTTGIARAVERLNRPHGSFIEGAAQWHP